MSFMLPALLLVAGCTTQTVGPPEPTQSPVPFLLPTIVPTPKANEVVRIAHTPSMAFAPLYIAADRGFAKKLGVDINLVDGGTFEERLAGLNDGTIDAAALNVDAPLIDAFAGGLRAKIVGNLSEWGPISPLAIVTAKNGPTPPAAETIADLRNKQIGIEDGPGSTSHFILQTALVTAELDQANVRIAVVPASQQLSALQNGTVDAVLTNKQIAMTAVFQDAGKLLFSDWSPGISSAILVFSDKFLAERPAVATSLMASLLQASRDIQGDRYLAADNVATYLRLAGVTADELQNISPLVYDRNLSISRSNLIDQERFFRETRTSSQITPLYFDAFLNDRIQIDAINKLALGR